MKRTFALLLALLLTLSLAGCGKDKDGTKKEGLFYEATGICPDAVLLEVDGRAVPAERYLYWLAYTCDYISNYYQSVDTALSWDEELAGETLADYAQTQALQNTVLYATVENWAAQYDVALSEDDQGAIDLEWDAKSESYGGEEGYLQALANMGLDKAGAQSVSADYYLYSHLYDLYQTEGSPLFPQEGEIESYAAIDGFLTVDHILISTKDVASGDDAGKAEKRAQAEEVFSKLNAATDPIQAFAAMAETYGDPLDREQFPDGYTFMMGNGTMSESFEAAAKTLEVGQWSGIVESNEGFYIILRKPLNLEAMTPYYFDDLLQTAADEAEVVLSDPYQNLEVGAFYDGLIQAREQLPNAENTPN